MDKMVKLKLFAVVILMAVSFVSKGQHELSSDESGNFIGQEKTVCGTVVQSLFAFNKPGQPTLLMLDKPFPDQDVTIVIFDRYKKNFAVNVGKYYTNKNVCVSGKIELNKNRLEIEIKDPSAIKIVEKKGASK